MPTSGYFDGSCHAGSVHADGPFICFYSDRPVAIGFNSLSDWRMRHFDCYVVEIVMGEWIDGRRTKDESVFLSGLTSRQATSSISRLCLEKPKRHFVKRRATNDRF